MSLLFETPPKTLMSLRTLFPSLVEEVYEALEAVGITTAQDVLFDQDPRIYQQLPSTILMQITELKAQVAERISAPATRADELFNREEKKENSREACSCGVDELDGLLGGFGKYGVIEIAGDKGSGKTVSSVLITSISSSILLSGTSTADRSSTSYPLS